MKRIAIIGLHAAVAVTALANPQPGQPTPSRTAQIMQMQLDAPPPDVARPMSGPEASALYQRSMPAGAQSQPAPAAPAASPGQP